MTRFKNSIYSIFASALLPFVMLGCLSMAAQNTVRVDGGMTQTFEMSEGGTGAIQKWILPERRSISRIEIHFDPIEPLRKHDRLRSDGRKQLAGCQGNQNASSDIALYHSDTPLHRCYPRFVVIVNRGYRDD